MNPSERVRIREVKVLSADWYVLKKTTFDYRLRNGGWKTVSRETYDRGNGATILLFHRRRGTVLLTRQFRLPAYVNGCADGMLIEACAGLLDGDLPEAAIRREAQEELGVEVGPVKKVMEAYMSPGSVTEKLHFFVAEYETPPGVSAGRLDEGEEIEVIEMRLEDALAKVERGEIQDGKTIMLLLWAQLNAFVSGQKKVSP
ncbi:MAG TPA: NUDIX domain-containing protein [Chthoniobacterales bacterium]